LDGTLTTVKYHGQSRQHLVSRVYDVDIVLTTYHTLAADSGPNNKALSEIEWYRVVLDEGDWIKHFAID
jgi:SWI/SNF-related matrix-associated actin-dependent regulator of chromatin subfamily A3